MFLCDLSSCLFPLFAIIQIYLLSIHWTLFNRWPIPFFFLLGHFMALFSLKRWQGKKGGRGMTCSSGPQVEFKTLGRCGNDTASVRTLPSELPGHPEPSLFVSKLHYCCTIKQLKCDFHLLVGALRCWGLTDIWFVPTQKPLECEIICVNVTFLFFFQISLVFSDLPVRHHFHWSSSFDKLLTPMSYVNKLS